MGIGIGASFIPVVGSFVGPVLSSLFGGLAQEEKQKTYPQVSEAIILINSLASQVINHKLHVMHINQLTQHMLI